MKMTRIIKNVCKYWDVLASASNYQIIDERVHWQRVLIRLQAIQQGSGDATPISHSSLVYRLLAQCLIHDPLVSGTRALGPAGPGARSWPVCWRRSGAATGRTRTDTGATWRGPSGRPSRPPRRTSPCPPGPAVRDITLLWLMKSKM